MILDAIKSVAGLGDKALSLIPDENQRRRLDHELKVAVMQAERAAVEMQARIVEEHGKSEGHRQQDCCRRAQSVRGRG